MVGAASGRINLPQLYSHTGGDLHGGASELMAMCACRPSTVPVLMVMVMAAWNKFASDSIPVGRREAVVSGSGSRLTNHSAFRVGGVARLVPQGAICDFLFFWGCVVPLLIFNLIWSSSRKKKKTLIGTTFNKQTYIEDGLTGVPFGLFWLLASI